MKYYFKSEMGSQESSPGQAKTLIACLADTVESEKQKLDEVNFDRFLDEKYNQFYDGYVSFGFGFMVENYYYGIYRLWSRLVFYSK